MNRIRPILFSLTLLTSSFLLFMVQPMIGRMVLPSLGGTPAVWNGCVLFFQVILLGGYAWAHYGPPRLGTRNHLLVHLCLLAIVTFMLPMQLISGWVISSTDNPLYWLFGQLTLCVGLPFFVISSSAPLLQRWYTESGSSKENDEPWFLYAVSNIGSLAALMIYPLLFERILGLTDQGWFWTGGFLLLCVLFVGSAALTLNSKRLTLSKSNSEVETTAAASLSWKQRLLYIFLAAVPSSLMLGVTTVVSTEVGSFPLMWSIPLALYLLTFVFVFSNRQLIPHQWMVKVLPMILIVIPILTTSMGHASFTVMTAVHFGAFFIMAMVCHGELAARRPSASQLTEFYLMMSIGGVCGGFLNSILAPVIFDSIFEYPLALVGAACVLVIARREAPADTDNRVDTAYDVSSANWTQIKTSVWFAPLVLAIFCTVAAYGIAQVDFVPPAMTKAIVFGVPAFICLMMVEHRWKFASSYCVVALLVPSLLDEHHVISQERGFFGVNAVKQSGGCRMLVNGRTLHGSQMIEDMENPVPLTYYHRTGPVGDLFRVYGQHQNRVAVVGLGVGTIAAYSQPGQQFDFYEIDPVVCKIASDEKYFSFLSTAKGDVNLILGDARIELNNVRSRLAKTQYDSNFRNVAFTSAKPKNAVDMLYGMIVLDAFGSDAVPLHLLTREAVALYFDLLNEDGLLAVHVSSKFIDFEPVGSGLADALGLSAIIKRDANHPIIEGKMASKYMIFARNRSQLAPFVAQNTGWRPLSDERSLLWTDEHGNVLDAVMW